MVSRRYSSRWMPGQGGAITVGQPAGRVNRTPKHVWYVEPRPFEIVPTMIAPVLPGETMKNMVFQSRTVTDPLANGLIGWWLDHMFFYVKHSQLENAATYMAMHIDPTTSVASIDAAALNAFWFEDDTDLRFVKECYDAVVDHYFRDEEDASSHTIGGTYEVAKVLAENWMDSLMLETVAEANDPTVVTESGTAVVKASDIDAAMRTWQLLRMNNLTTMDYEDYLQTFGIRTAEEVTDRPELIRHVREWQYPSNTIDPTDGSATAAVSWATQESASKNRFFKEPGFIFGVMVARPKVYFNNQTGAAVGRLRHPLSWLPAVMRDDPLTSQRTETSGSSLIGDSTAGYWWDVRDLFLYGDQFIHLAGGADPQASTTKNAFDLPANDISNVWYPSTGNVDELFSNSAGGLKYVREDGVASLVIAGTQVDYT